MTPRTILKSFDAARADALSATKRRAEGMRRVAPDNHVADAYYHGLRIGLVHAGQPASDALSAPRTRAYYEHDLTDLVIYASACGYVDGVGWGTDAAPYVGLLDLVIARHATGSRRGYARSIGRNERTLRRWASGEIPIQGAALELLRDALWMG